jgi:excisionase family DNA binding protein
MVQHVPSTHRATSFTLRAVDPITDRQSLVDALSGQANGAGDLRGRLLRTREVALLFRVSERAVTDWARRGRIPSVRTPGGHRRYPAAEVWALLENGSNGG